ncbi:MAG: hypothetical protein JNG84_04070 [Archangium sp.]|nr:hypothetical protein [Archangium sp.]
MSGRALVALLVLVGCGSPPKPPETITRGLPSNEFEPQVGPKERLVLDDGGSAFVDGGCCFIPFALRSMPGELSAAVVFPGESFDMQVDDAGVWRTVACVEPRADVYFYRTGYPTDDDAGVLLVDRVNEALPTVDDSNVAPRVNVFDVADAGVCESISTGLYSTLPDAGP